MQANKDDGGAHGPDGGASDTGSPGTGHVRHPGSGSKHGNAVSGSFNDEPLALAVEAGPKAVAVASLAARAFLNAVKVERLASS